MKSYLPIMLLFLVASVVDGQEVTLSVDAPETAIAGEGFRIVYTVNSTDGRFQPPVFEPSFRVSGPQSSSSRNVQWVNGEVTSVSTTTLIYYVIIPSPGHYTIAPAQYTTKKVTASSVAIEIEVIDAGASRPQGAAEGTVAPETDSEVSLKLILGRREVYVGQPVAATLKLYTRINLSGINELKYPDFKGLLREDIDTPPLKTLEPEVIDGVQYGTGVLQRFILYPQVAGEIRIDPVQITALVQQRTKGSDPFFNDPFFDNFFSGVTTVPRIIASQTAVITVKPLPSPVPADFKGAVGEFDISSSLSKNEISVNDALTYTLTLKGSGNLNLAGAPAINFPQGIEKYDPQVSVKSSGTAAGSKVFEYLLIPRNPGIFDLPPVSYTVFDAQQEKYITLRTQGYRITVTGSEGTTDSTTPLFMPGEEVKYLGQDIRFIRAGEGNLISAQIALIEKTYYWLWFLFALLLAAAMLLFRREQVRRNADIKGLRNRRAAKNARKRLAKANALLNGEKPELVYGELAGTLWGYLGDKMAIPMADLTREKCYTELRERKAGEEIIAELDFILSSSEYSRYSPSSGGESPTGLYKRTATLIRKLDDLLN